MPEVRRHILVLPDRDAAEEVAGELTQRFGLPDEPRPVREALAGEDDAEDAQWLVVLEEDGGGGGSGEDAESGAGGLGRYDPAELDALAAEHDGWHERE